MKRAALFVGRFIFIYVGAYVLLNAFLITISGVIWLWAKIVE